MKKQFERRRLPALGLAVLMMLGSAAVLALPAAAGTNAEKSPVPVPRTAPAGEAAAPAEKQTDIDFDENIMLSIFWPPTPAYINEEQYALIADAGINWVLGAGEETLATPANQKKMLELCEQYGLHLILSDGRFGSSLTSKTEKVIERQVSDYKDYPALGGFYILDEPYNANGFVDAYLNLKKAFPEGYMHLNFLPSGSYGYDKLYKAQMTDWCRLCEAGGYPVDYLIYDRYPFGLGPGSMDRAGFYSNLRAVHDVGLENGVRTGTYIQTIEQSVAFRRPTDAEIRYEMYSALAFGFKQLSFFTWFTPVNRSEPFADGIISADGKPNAHYETVKTINHEILTIGPILAKCDALGVYLNGADTWGQPKIPEDFFIQPAKRTQTFTLSWMRHKETGRNYVMIVNNNYSKSQSFDLTVDESVKSLFEVDRDTGKLIPMTLDGNKLSLRLEAGDAVFIALPEDFDFYKPASGQPANDENLMLSARILTSQSAGDGGYYISLLNDGSRTSDGTFNGWRSTSDKDVSLTVDLGEKLSFNRLDLYPEGDLFSYGVHFPTDFTLSSSDDGKTWTKITECTGVTDVSGPMSVTFKTVSARYLKLDLTGIPADYASFCELELYYDDGTVPAPAPFDALDSTKVVTWKQGMDLAKGKKAYCSSTTPDGAGYRSWGWSIDFINNGERGNGWTTNVKQHNKADATEFVIIDLGDVFDVDRVDVWPMGCFPEDFRIELSDDARNWKPFCERTGYTPDGDELVFVPDDDSVTAVSGRFLRFIATKLRGTAGDGFMLQLGNISAYGTPTPDASILTDAMAQYKDAAGDTSVKEYADCEAALGVGNLTQSQARAYARALLALIPEPETEAPTAAPTEPPTEPETEPETEPSTEAPTAVPATEPGTDAPKKSGCKSALGAAALLSLLAVIGTAAVMKKKH